MYQILLIDKAKGYTSHDVVNDLRRHLKLRRIGHTGTLDPFATGLMVMLIDKATKLSKYFVEHDKTYDAEITLGIETDSLDITGKVTSRKSVEGINALKVSEVLKSFIGKQKQMPPIFSAIKKDGKKLVDLARKNKEIPDIEPRDIEIYSCSEPSNFRIEEGLVKFSISMEVSKGTYIRAFARDIGIAMGSVGCLSELRRTKVGTFSISDAVCLECLHTQDYKFMNPIDHMNLDKLVIDDEFAKLVENGRFLPNELFKTKSDTILYNQLQIPIAIYTYDEEKNVMRMSVMLN